MTASIVIMLITYTRTEYAIRTIDATLKNLQTGSPPSWYICDDGSDKKHYDTIINHLKSNNCHICGHHSQKLGYGAGVNKSWKIASQTSPITLWMEDDWELEEAWDIQPYIDALNNNDDIGMIRLGHLPIGQAGEAVSKDNIMYMDIDKRKSFSFSGNPHLKHDRFMLNYGPYPTGLNPGETERIYDSIVKKSKNGPAIYWPIYIGDRYLFGHIGTIPSYKGES